MCCIFNEAYKEQAEGAELANHRQDISEALGYAIEPEDTCDSQRMLYRLMSRSVL